MSPIPVSAVFTADVGASFTASGIVVTNGGVASFAQISPTEFSFGVIADVPTGTVSVSIPSGAAHNALGAASLASNVLSIVHGALADTFLTLLMKLALHSQMRFRRLSR